MAESNDVTREQDPGLPPGVLPLEAPGPVLRKTPRQAPMTVAVERAEERTVPAAAPARRLTRAEAGERWISRLLRTGALCTGVLFLLSLVLESLPDSEPVHVAIDLLRKGAASALLVTPVIRLVVAGATLGLRGEWRYTLYATGVLMLLAVAMGAGLHA